MIGALLGWRGYVAAALAGGLIVGACAWGVRDLIADGNHARLVAVHAEVMQGHADRAATAAQALVERQTSHQQAVAALDTKYTKELTRANAEIDRLRGDVAAGRRLRVNAECPASAARMPATTSAAGVDDAAEPRLTGAAERDYFALRERIARADAMIEGLQGYVREVCLAR